VIKYNFKIPETVIYKVGRPKEWYFTGKDGTILMKNKRKLFNKCVYEDFIKGGHEASTSAYFYKRTKTDVTLTLHHMSPEALHTFMFSNNDKLKLDIAQKFS
jgi:hypothetical protein